MLLDDQAVLRIDCHLRIVADGHLAMGDHRACIGIGERNLSFAAFLQLAHERCAGLTLLAQSGDLGRQRLSAAGAGSILTAVDLVQFSQIALQSCIGRGEIGRQPLAAEVACPTVHRLEPRAVHRQQLSPEQVELAAQHHECAEHRLERGPVVAPEVSDGPKVWMHPAQQPDQLEIAACLRRQAPA
nr:hypothetical protein [Sphingomonas sp. JXJ CY 53]